MKKIADYIMLLRPTLLGPVWIFIIVGYRLSYMVEGKIMPRIVYSPKFWIGFLSYTLLMGGVYIINQIVDRKTDKINKKLFLISEGIISLKEAYIELILLFLISFLLIFYLKDIPLIIVWILSLIMGITYSVPPFRMKGRFLWDLVWNTLGYGLLNILFGAMLHNSISLRLFLFIIPYMCGISGIFIYTTLLDIEGDKEDGIKTTGMILGYKKGSLISLILLSIALFLSLYTNDIVLMIGAGGSLPFAIWAAVKHTRYPVIISMRIGPILLLLSLSYFAPYLLAFLLTAAILMRIYYEKRFNLKYPTLTGKG